MILHYAFLCQAAGGVDTFLVGSEFRGLTGVRGAARSYPFVAALRRSRPTREGGAGGRRRR